MNYYFVKSLFFVRDGVIDNPVIGQKEGEYNQVATNPLGPLIAKLWQTIVFLGGILLLIYLIWGAFEWLTSSGEADKVKHARYKITNAIIGLMLLVMSYAIVIFLEWLFGFSITNIIWPIAS